ncbi:MAG: DNA double-strand break repair nuclease NurA [Chloroflexi bacterium]|nr:DNA double-strand break repair nuclease NurA [Chloroflexota bacterium]
MRVEFLEMSLDLHKIAPQVGEMVSQLRAATAERQAHLHAALQVIATSSDLAHLRQKITASKTTWLVAGLADGLGEHYPAPAVPPEFTVIATDGSHIDVDRHRMARCCLINIGTVMLRYGAKPDATLGNIPQLYSGDQTLVIVSPEGRQQAVEGTLLGIKRNVEEVGQLVCLAIESPADWPGLALLDGTLILWGLEAYPEFVADALLQKGFLRHLDALKKLGGQSAVASYISFPRATDVVNALRVAICPHETVDCDRFCPPGKPRECDAVSGVQDRELFASLLGQGERSALFISQSSVVEKHYGEHRVHFFYLKNEEEIARVEIPQWVATNGELLNQTHALVLDQCRRGQGYPVALSEAHEQAVVTGADRENFWQLVELALQDEHLPSIESAKSKSKRMRGV